MSKLKSYAALISELNPNPVQIVYLKSEADKVIAELEEQIEVLKHQACKMNCMTFKLYNEECDANIHQKYKRCLAMARWCGSKVYHIRRTPLCDMSEHEYWQYENDFWQRWQKRWLDLA